MIGKVAVDLRPLVHILVFGVAGRKGAYTARSLQFGRNNPEDGRMKFVIQRRILHPDSNQLIRADVQVLATVVDIVSKAATLFIPEGLLIVGLHEVADSAPLLDESRGGAVLTLHLDGKANAVVPQSIGFHLITGALGNGNPVHIRVHPTKRDIFHLCPEQSVRMHGNLAPASGEITLQNAPDNHAVLLPDFGRGCTEHDVVLQY